LKKDITEINDFVMCYGMLSDAWLRSCTVYQKLDPLLFHHNFTLTKANCTNILESTQAVLLVVSVE